MQWVGVCNQATVFRCIGFVTIISFLMYVCMYVWILKKRNIACEQTMPCLTTSSSSSIDVHCSSCSKRCWVSMPLDLNSCMIAAIRFRSSLTDGNNWKYDTHSDTQSRCALKRCRNEESCVAPNNQDRKQIVNRNWRCTTQTISKCKLMGDCVLLEVCVGMDDGSNLVWGGIVCLLSAVTANEGHSCSIIMQSHSTTGGGGGVWGRDSNVCRGDVMSRWGEYSGDVVWLHTHSLHHRCR